MKKTDRETLCKAFETTLTSVDTLSDLIEDNSTYKQCKAAVSDVRVDVAKLVALLNESDRRTHKSFAGEIKQEMREYRFTEIDDLYTLEASIGNSFEAIFPSKFNATSF